MTDRNRRQGRTFAPAGHFYSPLTDRAETKAYFGSDHYRAQMARTDRHIDLDAMRALWADLADRMVVFPFERTEAFRYYGRNNQFEYYDASILSGMIRWLNPRRLIEIGAGFSSAAVFDTFDRTPDARLRSFLTIDPDLTRYHALRPPTFAEAAAMRVQEADIAQFAALEAGDILFIDSSHVLKTGSDVHFEYLHILPVLKPGVIVHIHDIFYPFDYPKGWAVQEGRSWNEVYLVDMILTFGDMYEIVMFNDAFLQKCADEVRRPGDMFDRFESHDSRPMHRLNGSIWLRRTGQVANR